MREGVRTTAQAGAHAGERARLRDAALPRLCTSDIAHLCLCVSPSPTILPCLNKPPLHLDDDLLLCRQTQSAPSECEEMIHWRHPRPRWPSLSAVATEAGRSVISHKVSLPIGVAAAWEKCVVGLGVQNPAPTPSASELSIPIFTSPFMANASRMASGGTSQQSRTIPLRQHIVLIYNYETKVNSAENKQVSAPKLIPLRIKTMLNDTVEKLQKVADLSAKADNIENQTLSSRFETNTLHLDNRINKGAKKGEKYNAEQALRVLQGTKVALNLPLLDKNRPEDFDFAAQARVA
ncbi:hypothetical protein KSP40_PGU016513 [Platanthera guangdongensis]|uniref:Uncharacterized protein n=1 Tax=Platanthera guangdongensis TaxID=2320717 RepID=A0ABR2LVL4_9ASPA